MSDSTPFKTPLPFQKRPQISDSEESESNSDGGSSGAGTGDNISLVILYDDLHRLVEHTMEEKDKIEDAFLSSAEEVKLLWLQWKTSVGECQRLQSLLTTKIEEASELERNLTQARKMLDEEKRKRKRAESQVEDWESQMARVCKTLFRDNRNILNTDEVKQQLASIHGRKSLGDPNQLSAIQEVNTTGSILSDLSYSRSEDDLDSSRCMRQFKPLRKLRSSNEGQHDEPAVKKRRSSSNKVVEVGLSETVKATTTLFVTREGPITATSVIESVPHSNNKNAEITTNIPSNLIFESWNHQEGTPNVERPQTFNPALRKHVLVPKTVVMPDTCLGCDNKIRFGKSVLRCKECKSYCHPDCKNILPLPCVPVVNTPHKKAMGTVSDYTPAAAPMVPSLVVQCINEIEQRGLEELGIYRVPGSEKDVKGLKEKLIYARVPTNLKDTDIHVICGCLKDFLRSLAEPLVTFTLWKDFIQAVKAEDQQDILPALYQTISELPQPNRDTLAYLILHLQKVAEAKDCKMPIDNIAKIFGPTVVGYSSEDLNPKQIVDETRNIVKVMEHLLNIPSDYWTSFINVIAQTQVTSRIQKTPSTDSLIRHTTSRLFTPTLMAHMNKSRRKDKGRLFYTPPSCK